MPLYLKSIGFSVLLIGILEGIAEATASLSKGYFGKLSDSKGQRIPFIRIGYTLSAISKPMMAIIINPVWIFCARTMDRFGKGVRTSARDALLSDESTKENKARVFGFHRGMDTLGAAIGPLFALLFLSFYPLHYKLLFYIAFIPGLIAISLTFLLKDKSLAVPASDTQYPIRDTHNHSGFFAFLKYWKTSPEIYKQLVIGLLVFTLFNSSDMFLLLGLKNKGFSDSSMIMFYIFYNIIYALFSYPSGVIADKFGLKRVLTGGLFLFSLVYLFYGFADKYWMFILLFLIYGIYAASTEGIFKALIANISDKTETATAIGFYNSFAGILSLFASTIAGIIWVTMGPKYTFIISGIGTLMVISYLTIVFSVKKINC